MRRAGDGGLLDDADCGLIAAVAAGVDDCVAAAAVVVDAVVVVVAAAVAGGGVGGGGAVEWPLGVYDGQRRPLLPPPLLLPRRHFGELCAADAE